MKCYYHQGIEAVAVCTGCHKAVCQDCAVDVAGEIYCKSCIAERIRRKELRVNPLAAGGYYIASAIGGGLLGMIPAILFRGISPRLAAPFLYLAPVGFMAGLLLAAVLRGRIERRGGQRAIIGAILLASLFSCLACNVLGTMTSLQNIRQAQQIIEMEEKMGLRSKSASTLQAGPNWWGLLCVWLVLITLFVIGLLISVRLIFPAGESPKSTTWVAKGESVLFGDRRDKP